MLTCPTCGLPDDGAGDLCDCRLDDADEMGLLPFDEPDDDSDLEDGWWNDLPPDEWEEEIPF